MSEDLSKLLLNASLNDVEEIAKAENLPDEGTSIDWLSHFFEPEVGQTYLIKFLPNLDPNNAQNICHRTYYKLPDPENGGSFHYNSKGKGCKILELFFRLHKLAKDGDPVAEMKIKRFLSNKRQACAKVQILGSSKKEDIGKIRLFKFQSYGENAIIANLLDNKLNPSKEILNINTNAKENVFNIFGSSIMNLVCKEGKFGDITGRSFAGSTWVDGVKKGAFVKLENDEIHAFSVNDLTPEGGIKPEVIPFVDELVKELTSQDLSMYEWFQYKNIDDPRNTEDTIKYLKDVERKVDLVIPIIEDLSISEINKKITGKKTATTTDKEGESKDILKESLPEELQNLQTSKQESTNASTPKNGSEDDLDSLLK